MLRAIAHRGEPRGHRENTLPAIRAAAAYGPDLVEIDLRLTADGEVVLLHDPTLRRLWEDRRAIDAVTASELREVGRPDGDCRVPTLHEALDVAAELDLGYMLDVTSAPIGLAVADVLAARGREDRMLYAGDTDALAAIRKRRPDAEIALSWGSRTPPEDRVWQAVRPRYFNPDARLVTRQLVSDQHEQGREVSTWTVDERADMIRLRELGVDAIITNEIATLVEVLGRRPAQERVE